MRAVRYAALPLGLALLAGVVWQGTDYAFAQTNVIVVDVDSIDAGETPGNWTTSSPTSRTPSTRR